MPPTVATARPLPNLTRSLALQLGLLTSLLFSACTMKTGAFDPDTWKAQRVAKALDNKRVHMVSQMESVVRVGMPRADVVRLLGEPDVRDDKTDTDRYVLGLAMGPDEQFYDVRYKSGAVSALQLGQY